jgi:hypothetical protein
MTSFYTITIVASNPISVFTLFISFKCILFVYFDSHMNSIRPYMWRFHLTSLIFITYMKERKKERKKKDKHNSTGTRFYNRKSHFHMLHFENHELSIKAFTTLTDSGIPVCFIMGAAGKPGLLSRTT